MSQTDESRKDRYLPLSPPSPKNSALNQRELFLRHVAQTSDTPMMGVDIDIVSASGCTLTARNGKKYTDLISGISVSNVGHCHPRVVEAIKNQSEKFMHLMVYGEFNQQPQVRYAETLAGLLPSPLESVYFTTGGSEAVEGACKLAKRATGRTEIISFHNAYHGSTQGALSLMGNETLKSAFRPLIPGGRILPFNDVAALDQITNSTAAVIIEPVQGEAGVRIAGLDFIKSLRKKCGETGALLIFDEIQTGFGRTGTLFAFEQYGVVPDVLLLAKGMGGGMPIGAFVASRELMNELTHNPMLGHINTFGGNAVCVAAAQACLDVIVEEKLWLRAKEIEKKIQKIFTNQDLKEVRVKGALAAIDFGDEASNMSAIKKGLDNGLVTDWFLFCNTAMRIAPPLVDEKNVIAGLQKLSQL
jgi:acetylornithine/N-succinyldiaminopimelate aminotransferase